MFVNRHANRRENKWEEPRANNSKVTHYGKFKPGYAESYQFILFFLKLKIKIIKVKYSQIGLDLGSRDF